MSGRLGGTKPRGKATVSAGIAEDLRAAAAEQDVPLAATAGDEVTAGDADGGAGGVRLRFRGRVAALSPEDRHALLDRAPDAASSAVPARVAAIIARVRREGDAALVAMAREFDGADLGAPGGSHGGPRLEVPRAEWRAALEEVDAGLRRAMERAVANVRAVHEAFRPKAAEVEPEPGILVGRRPDPLGRVGVYAPGGRAAYPSSLVMGVVPAKVAGVGEVVVCSPPAGPDGLPSAVVLAAAALAGADRVFALGGAGAVAAMAYGTESVPRADRIVGPGNAYVAEAKVQVSRVCGIDSPAGPSELLVIADHTADPAAVARELVAQAEHDPMAAVVCVAVGDETAEQVEAALAALAPAAGRREIVEAALAAQGAVLVAQTYDEAAAFASEYAAEHLQLSIGEPEQKLVLSRLRNTGTVFLGETTSVAYGDYMTGANHVLPTGGLARSYSGLSTLDFVRWTTYQRVTPQAAAKLAYDVGRFADAEGLPGHAEAARAWMKTRDGGRTRLAERAFRQRLKRIAADAGGELLDGGALPACVADASDTVNLWGAPPDAVAALGAAATAAMLSTYPALYNAELKAPLAAYAGVDADALLTGCGSDDVIDCALRAFGEPGGVVAHAAPTFSMVPAYARANGMTPVGVPLAGDDYAADADALLAADAAVIYLCSPNNPTSTPLARALVERVVAGARGLVILDEAYAEYVLADAHASAEVFTPEAPGWGRVLATRTLSKAFGLAGLRVGYGVGHPDVVRAIEKARGPFKVTFPAEAAVRAALGEGGGALGWVRAHARLAVAQRDALAAGLRALGLAPAPAAAHFVFVPVPDARAVAGRMRARHGVGVRVFDGLPTAVPALGASGGSAFRLNVGPDAVQQRVLAALAAELGAGGEAGAGR